MKQIFLLKHIQEGALLTKQILRNELEKATFNILLRNDIRASILAQVPKGAFAVQIQLVEVENKMLVEDWQYYPIPVTVCTEKATLINAVTKQPIKISHLEGCLGWGKDEIEELTKVKCQIECMPFFGIGAGCKGTNRDGFIYGVTPTMKDYIICNDNYYYTENGYANENYMRSKLANVARDLLKVDCKDAIETEIPELRKYEQYLDTSLDYRIIVKWESGWKDENENWKYSPYPYSLRSFEPSYENYYDWRTNEIKRIEKEYENLSKMTEISVLKEDTVEYENVSEIGKSSVYKVKFSYKAVLCEQENYYFGEVSKTKTIKIVPTKLTKTYTHSVELNDISLKDTSYFGEN